MGRTLLIAIATWTGMVGTAAAHHSFAMFDLTRTETLAGTVKAFEMINPHGWLTLLVVERQGQQQEWSLETGAPIQLGRIGWQRETVKVGDKVTVTLHPFRDGSNGGQLLSVRLSDGRTLGGGTPGSDGPERAR